MGVKIDHKRLKRKLELSKNPFLSLTRSIIYQQISTKAGDAINRRFLKLFGRKAVTAKNLQNISDADLRGVGLSQQKLSYLRDLSAKFIDGTVNPKKFKEMSDEQIREHLVAVKGIGVWTADMFLIFALNRPNILPVGDLGIKKGFQKVFKLRTLPSEAHMRRLAKPHEGQHSYFALYLWEALDGDK
jgi:DNA-3-methyladenine glycosylase II